MTFHFLRDRIARHAGVGSDGSAAGEQLNKCGRGGIGRHVGFRFQWISVQVQVLSHVPKGNAPQRGAFSFGLRKAGLEPIRCNADEHCRRGLDRGEHLFSAKAENANQVLSPVPEKDSDCDTIRVFFN